MNNESDTSPWFEYDPIHERYTFHGTENYVWGKKHGPNKRVGDMSRDELIHVIAVTFLERDQLKAKLEQASQVVA